MKRSGVWNIAWIAGAAYENARTASSLANASSCALTTLRTARASAAATGSAFGGAATVGTTVHAVATAMLKASSERTIEASPRSRAGAHDARSGRRLRIGAKRTVKAAFSSHRQLPTTG